MQITFAEEVAQMDAEILSDPNYLKNIMDGMPIECLEYDENGEGLVLSDNVVKFCTGCGRPIQMRPFNVTAKNAFCQACATTIRNNPGTA